MSAASRTRGRAQNFAGRELSEEEAERVLSNDRLRFSAFPIFFAFLGLSMFALAMTPLARSIAGTDTHFDVQISLAFNMALGITTAGGGLGCWGLDRARRRHKRRARKLELDLLKLKAAVP